ncbi:hypothetical protein PZA11_000696 [Diplocarpon coronariae]|uniref:SUN domain-containing protein n=1 Tax=Diplocarpon coronariae TaxID=2795749 RepID=A0A218YRI6_9HELO|nr:hypothetical protein B2J93_1477 [Marssonina coronariae]
MKFGRIALLGAATLVVAQPHNHVHKHAARRGPLEDRDDGAATKVVPGPTVNVYELNGKPIEWDKVLAGLISGEYVLPDKNDEIPSSSTPTATPSPAAPYSMAAQFLEEKSSTPVSTSTIPIPTYEPLKATPIPTPTPSPSKAYSAASYPQESANNPVPDSSSSGIDQEFPDGSVDCDDFDTLAKYGAVPADWLELGGYTGIQITPLYSPGASVITFIETGVPGGGCVKNSFCSYACPAGYQKSQYPEAQGATGESVGGLYCNAQGKLELTRKDYKTLCQKGVGGVEAHNSLSEVVSICRTDYPGSESETVAVEAPPGGSVEITCPDSNTYYEWQGKPTTAQYYINPSGYPKEEACIWGKPGTNIGNWAPVNLGLGRSTSGLTFMSLFPNKPTNPDGVLDFNIKITGDVSGDCKYVDGQYYDNGAPSPTGCTVGVTGNAVVEFY